MKILLVGSGGRESAIAFKIAQNEKVSKIYVAPGNGGTALYEKCENLNITDIDELLSFAKENNIDLTIVGPEEPLTKGIVDKFRSEGLRIFGPDKKGAELEGSKSFSKDFMKKYGVSTAEYEVFYDAEEAKAYLETCSYPIVIKADGLAAGKGVVICEELNTALDTIDLFMVQDMFKGAGRRVVIEEFLVGIEASILSITDGKTIIPFLSAKDHKQIFDGNKGPNTGGMGVVCPNPYVTDGVLKDFYENIMDKTLMGIREEGMDFKGIIFFGIMITEKGVKLLEYNVRMGDPETQSVLTLMKTDLLDLIEKALDEKLEDSEVEWEEGYCVNVVLSSKGYPDKACTGYEIEIDNTELSNVFVAGAKLEEGKLITNGGRVLSVVGKGRTLEEAREAAYKIREKVNFEGAYCRSDIGIAK
ncbi:phosphoribosylamine--glycine ligase [Clostridium sp. NSJ-49]|uniref:Phosphoribosylamine--glycine ligase n=1 Tax=Clostridium disporicum TaxID=84024 RepID=A0A174E8V4_9CLOT|nr:MULTISPECIES: phosphoribosylamine--glycine ligase [Clostridium]MBC5626694.1 phosphoribosylamine--glycine ligase [Clostridium sp. NSJ-49]CUO33787.1 phosphoribosylamine--glycine ligase [Clostridium disporicum]